VAIEVKTKLVLPGKLLLYMSLWFDSVKRYGDNHKKKQPPMGGCFKHI